MTEEHLEKRDPWGLGLSSGRLSGGVKRVTRASRPTHGHRHDGAWSGARYGTAGGERHGAARRIQPGSTTVHDGWEEPTIDLHADRDATPEYLGKLVRHPKYGRGVVLSQDGTGEKAKLQVRFMGQMTRKLIARFVQVEEEDGA